MTAAIIALDGCEKAGKTTLAKEILKLAGALKMSVRYLHLSGSEPFTQEVSEWLMTAPYDVVVLDRTWASTWVYDALGHDQLQQALPYEEAERTIGRQIERWGVRRILVQRPEILEARRTADDIGDPDEELALWLEYAGRHKWETLQLPFGTHNIEAYAISLLGEALTNKLSESVWQKMAVPRKDRLAAARARRKEERLAEAEEVVEYVLEEEPQADA